MRRAIIDRPFFHLPTEEDKKVFLKKRRLYTFKTHISLKLTYLLYTFEKFIYIMYFKKSLNHGGKEIERIRVCSGVVCRPERGTVNGCDKKTRNFGRTDI